MVPHSARLRRTKAGSRGGAERHRRVRHGRGRAREPVPTRSRFKSLGSWSPRSTTTVQGGGDQAPHKPRRRGCAAIGTKPAKMRRTRAANPRRARAQAAQRRTSTSVVANKRSSADLGREGRLAVAPDEARTNSGPTVCGSLPYQHRDDGRRGCTYAITARMRLEQIFRTASGPARHPAPSSIRPMPPSADMSPCSFLALNASTCSFVAWTTPAWLPFIRRYLAQISR